MHLRNVSVAVLTLVSLPAFADRFVVLGPQPDRLPPGLRAALESRGATVVYDLGAAGMLVVEAASADVANGLGARAVLRDFTMQSSGDTGSDSFDGEAAGAASLDAGPLPTDDQLPLQWGWRAVGADVAYAAGLTGRGVRIAVIDSGANVNHPDIGPNVNLALSRSFVAGEGIVPPIVTPAIRHHGTYVTSIIAAPANNGGIVGVAPEAEVVVLKASDHFGNGGNGSAQLADLLAAMVYAGEIEARVVNMSIGGIFSRSGGCSGTYCWTAQQLADDFVGLARAAAYIRHRGGLLVVSAGNDGLDLNQSADTLVLPAMLPHAVAVSATAPIATLAVDPGANLDEFATYSNYGQRLVTIAAPGGFSRNDYPPTCFRFVAGMNRPCAVFNRVRGLLTPTVYGQTSGTSAAAPHVAGVAALIIEAAGGNITPDQVEARLREWAVDLGKPGVDEFFGHGRVDVRGAIAP